MDANQSNFEIKKNAAFAAGRSNSPQRLMLRFLAFAGMIGGVLLLVFALTGQQAGRDIIQLAAGGILLLGSVLILFVSPISTNAGSNLFVLIVFALTQVLFALYGWSGQSLLPWLVFILVTHALLNRFPSSVWTGLGIASLLFWFILAATNRVHQAIVITQNSLIMDAALILIAAIIGTVLIRILRQSYSAINTELEKHREQASMDVQNSQNQLLEMENRLATSQIASDISLSLSSVLDPTQLIQQAANEIKTAFDLYYVGIFLIDPAHEYAVLRYGTGEEGQRMVANRHRLAVGGYSMIGWTTQTHQPRVALDVGEEAVHFDNPELPDTRSELSMPIQTGNGILGAITIQSSKPNAFSQELINVFQRIADSLALALERANTFTRTQQTLEEIQVLNRSFVQQTWGERAGRAGVLKYTYENPKAVTSSNQTTVVKVPLVLRNETIGFFNLEVEGDDLRADQKEFLQAISTQTSTALENARLLEETQRAAAQEQKLNQITAQFSRATTIDEVLRAAVNEFGNLPSVSEASITLIPPDELMSNDLDNVETGVNS
jgi:GAF domain-containing protein